MFRTFARAFILMIAAAAIPGVALADEPSAIHGFFDYSLKNAYITPRGLLVTNKGETMQILSGLVFDLYDDKTGVVNNVSFIGGVWNDIALSQNSPTAKAWNEFDWFLGPSVTFYKDWTAGVTFVQFVSPPGAFKPETNIEFSLNFDDSAYLKPVSIHPYVKLFYEVSGPSTVVLGARGPTYDVELGMTPTLDVKPFGIPVKLTAPTWITVGPASYWGGTSNFGVFSTGINAKTPLSFIPARYGNWYVDAGVQYYNLINGKLVAAQMLTLGTKANTEGNNNVWVGQVGIGFGF